MNGLRSNENTAFPVHDVQVLDCLSSQGWDDGLILAPFLRPVNARPAMLSDSWRLRASGALLAT
jgi:hypothetical protein